MSRRSTAVLALLLAPACTQSNPAPAALPTPTETGTKTSSAVSSALADRALNGPSLPQRLDAIQALGQSGDREAALRLIPLLESVEGQEPLAAAARKVLLELDAEAVLVQRLETASPERAQFILRQLAQLGDRRARAAVRARLEPKPAVVREAAVFALGKLGLPEDVPAVAQALQAAEVEVRMTAAAALGQLGGPEAKAALQRAKTREQDGFVLSMIDSALSRL